MKKKIFGVLSVSLLFGMVGFNTSSNSQAAHAIDIDCPICDASGYIKVKCDECNGQGFWDCPFCEDGKDESCWQCGGTGVYQEEPCFNCDGMGFFDCAMCDGTGKMECPLCGGLTYMEEPCANCGGSKTIHEHDFASEFTYDDNHHWRAATCGHNEEKEDFGAHDNLGQDGSCSVCKRPAPHTHGNWQYSLTMDVRGIIVTCGNSPCPDGATITLYIFCDHKEFEYTGNPVEISLEPNAKAEWEERFGSAPELVIEALENSQLTDGKAVNPGLYKASISAGGVTAHHNFEIAAHEHGNWSISTDVNNYAIVLTCNNGGCENPAHTERLSLANNEKEFEYTGNPIELSLNSDGVAFWQEEFERVPEIVYAAKSGSSLTNNKPVNIGSYKATITEEGHSVTFEFDIIAPTHTHSGVKQNGLAATEQAPGYKDYYKCSCDKLFEEAACTTEITDLNTWKAEGGRGFIAKLTHTHKNPTKHDAEEPKNEGEYGVKEYYECSCGNYFEDLNCSKEIGDAAALTNWKNNGGRGSYFAPLPQNDGLSGGAIAGIVIGSSLFLLVVTYVAMYFIWKNKGIGIGLLVPSFRTVNKLLFKTTLNDLEKRRS